MLKKELGFDYKFAASPEAKDAKIKKWLLRKVEMQGFVPTVI